MEDVVACFAVDVFVVVEVLQTNGALCVVTEVLVYSWVVWASLAFAVTFAFVALSSFFFTSHVGLLHVVNVGQVT